METGSLTSCKASVANEICRKTETADGRIRTTKLGPMGDVRQAAVNFYYKQLYSTAPIAVNTIVKPTAATDIPPPMQTDPRTVPAWIVNDDCDTVTKVEAKLLRMQEYWAESRTGPFPESVRNVITDLQATFEKRDRETIANPSPASTTTTATIPAPANTATPAIYETATTATTPTHTDTAAPTAISETAATPV